MRTPVLLCLALAFCSFAQERETKARLQEVRDLKTFLPADAREYARLVGFAGSPQGVYALFAYAQTPGQHIMLYWNGKDSAQTFRLRPGSFSDPAIAADGSAWLVRFDSLAREQSVVTIEPRSVKLSEQPLGRSVPFVRSIGFAGTRPMLLSTDGTLSEFDGRVARKLGRLQTPPPMPEAVADPGTSSLTVVDPHNGTTYHYDLAQRLVAPIRLQGSAVKASLAQAAQSQRQQTALSRAPGDQQQCAECGQGGAMAIYGVARRGGSFYFALAPYNRFQGALVAEVLPNGATKRTVRCPLPKDATGTDVTIPSRVSWSQDRLHLVSGDGLLMTYQVEG